MWRHSRVHRNREVGRRILCVPCARHVVRFVKYERGVSAVCDPPAVHRFQNRADVVVPTAELPHGRLRIPHHLAIVGPRVAVVLGNPHTRRIPLPRSGGEVVVLRMHECDERAIRHAVRFIHPVAIGVIRRVIGPEAPNSRARHQRSRRWLHVQQGTAGAAVRPGITPNKMFVVPSSLGRYGNTLSR